MRYEEQNCSICQPEGWVGKSTLCILFANYLAYKHKPVCIIDTDLQKTIMSQRAKDAEVFEDEEPYSIQDFDISDPETMQQLMDSARQVDGFVLMDSPGNVSEDGLVPLFTVPTISSARMNTRRRPSTLPESS